MDIFKCFRKSRHHSPNEALVLSPSAEQSVIDTLDEYFDNHNLYSYEIQAKGAEIIVSLVFKGDKETDDSED